MKKIIKVAEVLNGNYNGKKISVGGWVKTRRDSKGGFSFVEINDGSIFDNLQIIVPAEIDNYEAEVKLLFTGACIEVEGIVVESQGSGQAVEIQAEKVVVHGNVNPSQYPLQKQRTSFEHLRLNSHLRPRTNSFGAIARIRNKVAMAIHDFFQAHDFLWVSTPIITASDCEGAGELFKVTTLDHENPPKTDDGKVDYSKDFFEKPSFLTVSGQLNVENYACSLGNVYTFGPTFRAENSNTSRHLAEFWMIEPEITFADLDDDMKLAEEFVKYVVKYALDNLGNDLKFFDKRIQPGLLDMLKNVVESEFVKLPYTEAIEILVNSGETWEFPIEWGSDLQAEHERYLTETKFKKPVIVYDWPISIKPFYMKVNDDGKTVRAMDVLVPHFGEIIGGSQREERLDILESRMKDCGMNPDDYWWYVDLRKFGTVPHAGFGLGFERMLQFITGMTNIRDVIPFPRTPGNADF